MYVCVCIQVYVCIYIDAVFLWLTDKKCIAWIHCRSLWIKASDKCINVYIYSDTHIFTLFFQINTGDGDLRESSLSCSLSSVRATVTTHTHTHTHTHIETHNNTHTHTHTHTHTLTHSHTHTHTLTHRGSFVDRTERLHKDSCVRGVFTAGMFRTLLISLSQLFTCLLSKADSTIHLHYLHMSKCHFSCTKTIMLLMAKI